MSGTDPHRFELRVYYEDTDAGGIVYHASYLRFAERARTEMLRDAGFTHGVLRDEAGVIFAVRRLGIEYLAPARLDDLLTVETRTQRAGGARFGLVQVVMRGEVPLARLEVELAVLGAGLRPSRLPEGLRQRLSAAAGAPPTRGA